MDQWLQRIYNTYKDAIVEGDESAHVPTLADVSSVLVEIEQVAEGSLQG